MRLAPKSRHLAIAAIVCFNSMPLWAHEAASAKAAMRWSWEPWVVIPILGTILLYSAGRIRMQRRSANRLSPWPAVSFAMGIAALVIALDSPVHTVGEQLFWVHMTQHELLMLVAAPLLVMAAPLVPFLWALPRSWREWLGHASKTMIWSATWIALSS